MKPEKRYDWDATDYARHSAAQRGWARELMTRLKLAGGESVLDIGCGDGVNTADIAAQVPEGFVLGVDSSEDMIASAKKRFPPERCPNLSFQTADARRLPFEARFDVIFSNAALHWVRNHAPVLAGIEKSLRPGGRILLQMGGKGNAALILSVLDVLCTQEAWRPFFDGFEFPYGFHEPETYTKWLREAMLKPVRVVLIEKDMAHADRDGMAGWIRTTWLPYTNRLPSERRSEFIEHIVETYLAKHPPDPDGTLHVGMVRLEVEAVKPA